MMEERRANAFKYWLSGVTLSIPIMTGLSLAWMRSIETKVEKLDAISAERAERIAIVETRNSSLETRFVEMMSKLVRIEDKIDRITERVK